MQNWVLVFLVLESQRCPVHGWLAAGSQGQGTHPEDSLVNLTSPLFFHDHMPLLGST